MCPCQHHLSLPLPWRELPPHLFSLPTHVLWCLGLGFAPKHNKASSSSGCTVVRWGWTDRPQQRFSKYCVRRTGLREHWLLLFQGCLSQSCKGPSDSCRPLSFILTLHPWFPPQPQAPFSLGKEDFLSKMVSLSSSECFGPPKGFVLTLASRCSIFLFHIRLWAFSLQIKKYISVFSPN